MLRRAFIYCLGLIIWLSITVSAQAEDNFHTAFHTQYLIGQDAMVTVNQQITLTNETADTYASEYTLIFGSPKLRNIKTVNDDGSVIPHRLETIGNATKIHLQFNEPVVGKGKTTSFKLQYEDPDLAHKSGKVLEVNLPKLDESYQIDDYQVTLDVPVEFGQPANLNPKPTKQENNGAFNSLLFQETGVKDTGITAYFGDQQTFEYILHYRLENPTITPIVTQIALPPDTPYQRVYINRLDPSPKAVTIDGDGNWIATYELEPRGLITVKAEGFITTSIKANDIPVTVDNLNHYLTGQEYWPVNDPVVKELANRLKTPQAIYDYLVQNFKYNYSRIDNQTTTRLGAVAAIHQPQNALCLEFADTFVTLTRAVGIPSRLLTGYAYTQNNQTKPLSLVQNELHAWAEYYDQEQGKFLPVDPTWGNTTGGNDYFHQLDFNHLVFAIQGLSSTKPYPVGLYQTKDQDTKNIAVSVSKALPQKNTLIDAGIKSVTNSFFHRRINVMMTIANRSNYALYRQPINISSSQLALLTAAPAVPRLAPFSTGYYGLEFTPAAAGSYQYEISSRISDQEQVHVLRPEKPVWQAVAFAAATLGLATIAGLLAYRARYLLVSKRR